MISGFNLGTELKRFGRTKLGRIAIAAIILMPLLYSALYLWAFWNPFGNVNKLPIAFVNEDKGTVVKGEKLNAGDQIVDNLKGKDEIHFDFVSKQDALDGVKDGRYYFVVELTPDFSEAVASPAGDEPRQAVIKTTYNDTNGYLSTMIGENVMRTMLPVISEEIGSQAIDKVLVGIQSAGTGLTQAADGAGKLAEGAGELSQGLDTATAGADKLATGAGTVDEKLGELGAGAHKLADGTQTLADGVDSATVKLQQLTTGVDQLSGGVDELGAGATQINNGVQQLKTQLDQVTATQTNASAQVRQLVGQLRGVAGTADAVRQLDQLAYQLDTQGLGANAPATQQINQLAGGTSQLAYQLSDPNAPFRSGFDQLHSGTGQLPGKLGELQSGITQLNDGAHQLAQGTDKLKAEGTVPLAEAATKLSGGLGKLDEGAKKLDDGAGTLSTKLREGSEAVPQWNTAQREHTASVLGGPVALQQTNEAGNNTFGGGLAPFFFSLALFIGGIIIFLLLRPMQNRAIASGVAPLRATLDGLFPAGLISILQATVVVAVTIFGVGMDPKYPIGLLLFAMAVSIMFTAVNQMLNVALGPGPGKVAAMSLLMFQILASGGLYPVETEPKIFAWLHPINPMTYSVNGFRQLMYGNVDHRLAQALFAVAVITGLALFLTALCARRDRMWTMKRLHPAINL